MFQNKIKLEELRKNFFFSPNELLVLDEWFKLGPSRNSYVECLGCEERLEIKEIEIVVINQVSEKLVAKAIEG